MYGKILWQTAKKYLEGIIEKEREQAQINNMSSVKYIADI